MTRKKLREYVVPMRWTVDGYIVVDAVDADEAYAKAEKLDHKSYGGLSGGEVVDWEVMGLPEVHI